MHDRLRVTLVLLAALVTVAVLGFWSWQVTSGGQPVTGPGALPGGGVVAGGDPGENGGPAGSASYPPLPQAAVGAGQAPAAPAVAGAAPAGSRAPQAAPEEAPTNPSGEGGNPLEPLEHQGGNGAAGVVSAGQAFLDGGAPAGAAPQDAGIPDGEAGSPGKAVGAAGSSAVPEPGQTAGGNTVVVVTRDFGRQVLLDKEVELESAGTVLALLQELTEVDTGYGGNFVRGINGLGGEPGRDWFYYVNGVAAGVGAGEYRLRPGDRVWWDHHLWRASGLVPAVVGSYPAPFNRTYGGQAPRPVIAFAPEAAGNADSLRQAWASLGIEAEVKAVEEHLLEARSAPVLVLGTWTELRKLSYLEEMNRRGARAGLFARFTPDGIELLDATGERAAVLEAGAAIQATGQGLGDAAPLWLVVGTGAKWLDEAVRLMQESPEALRLAYGLVLGAEGPSRLPAQ